MSNEEWIPVTATSDVAVGAMLGTQARGVAIAIYNVDGSFYATHDICTHQFAHLSDGWFEGKLIECPLHAGQFDVTTGKGMGPPITCDLRTFPVRVVADVIEVQLVEVPATDG
jgi:nitrite reductase/ring-hydroxylating ferredoxin subunit